MLHLPALPEFLGKYSEGPIFWAGLFENVSYASGTGFHFQTSFMNILMVLPNLPVPSTIQWLDQAEQNISKHSVAEQKISKPGEAEQKISKPSVAERKISRPSK